MDVDVFVTAGLGDNSFLVASHGEAVLVDPQRDAWRFLAAAQQKGLRVRGVLETHVHNDYVSGALEVRAATGAELLLPAGGGYDFPHRRAAEGQEFRIGALRLVAIETPGHTYEHLAWLAYEDGRDEPSLLFSGGSLLVGSAGRVDLLGLDHVDALTAAQFATVRRLAELPDSVQVMPTHGAGSFCVAAMPSTQRTSTMGQERSANPLLSVADRAEFAAELSDDLMAYPAYYARMAPINRSGPAVLGGAPQLPAALTPQQVGDRAADGVWVVDARDREEFAAGHLPGAVNIELNSGFGSYLGWILPFAAPIVVVLPEPLAASAREVVTQLLRIGWPAPAGYLDGGMAAWTAAGLPVRAYRTADVGELCAAIDAGDQPRVLDVRQELERRWGSVPGSEQIFLAELPERLDALSRDAPWWVVCSNGHRAAIAASLLDRAEAPVVLVGGGGVGELRQRCGARLAGAGR
jgi:hydroxyacylglutathione hydrolase